MPFVPTPNVIRASIEYVVSGLPAANIIHCQHALSPLSQTEIEDLAANVASVWEGKVMPLITSNVELVQVVATDVSSQTGVQGSAVSGTVGASGSAPLPPNIATCVSIKTALRSRNGRGRCYIPGVGEDKVDGAGTITPAYRAALETAFVDLALDLAAAPTPCNLGVLSLYSQSANPVPPHERAAGVFNVATTFAVDATIDTQRRRLR